MTLTLLLVCSPQPQVLVAKASDTFPPYAFLLAPIAHYRAVHLLALRTYNLAYLDGEMVQILGFLCFDAIAYFFGAQYLDAVLPRQCARTHAWMHTRACSDTHARTAYTLTTCVLACHVHA